MYFSYIIIFFNFTIFYISEDYDLTLNNLTLDGNGAVRGITATAEFNSTFYPYMKSCFEDKSLQLLVDSNETDEDYKRIASEEKVPARTYFLVRESDNKIIGMINIRLTLNKRLEECGGHIGYGIRPTERRKGYNKINLYQSWFDCFLQCVIFCVHEDTNIILKN